MLLDPTIDHAVFDDLIAVTVARGDGTLSVYGVKATTGNLSTREIMLGGPVGLSPTDRVFVLYANTCEGLLPMPGDVITDAAGVKWSVVTVSEHLYGGLPVTYRMIARRQI